MGRNEARAAPSSNAFNASSRAATLASFGPRRKTPSQKINGGWKGVGCFHGHFLRWCSCFCQDGHSYCFKHPVERRAVEAALRAGGFVLRESRGFVTPTRAVHPSTAARIPPGPIAFFMWEDRERTQPPITRTRFPERHQHPRDTRTSYRKTPATEALPYSPSRLCRKQIKPNHPV